MNAQTHSRSDLLKERQKPHDEAKEKAGCKGLFFRYRGNNYFHEGKLEFKKTFTKLKRKSCPGCNLCQSMEDDLGEDLELVIFPDNLTNEGIYELKVVNMTTDCETGYVDNWDIEFFPAED